MLAGNIIVFRTKTTILRQNSSLLSSARPIIFLQNKNVDGLFLRRFLVKKLDIFSQHATGEAYLFCVDVIRCKNLCFTKMHRNVAACLKEGMANLKQR